jgi:hypothetical protein
MFRELICLSHVVVVKINGCKCQSASNSTLVIFNREKILMRAIQLAVMASVLLMMAAASEVRASFIISNLPGNDGTGSLDVSSSRIKAMGFTMPSGVPYALDAVHLRLGLFGLDVDPVLQIFDNDLTGNPGAALTTLANPAFTATGIDTYIFTPQGSFMLESDTTYWLVLNDLGASRLDWMANDPGIEPTGIATHFGAKWPISGTAPYNDSQILNSYAIEATPVPEPSSLALLGIGSLALAFGAYRRRQKRVEHKRQAV